eukprot:gene2911-1150_t
MVKEYRATTSYQFLRKLPSAENGNYIWKILPAMSSTSYFLEVYWLTFNVQGSMPKCDQDSVEVFITSNTNNYLGSGLIHSSGYPRSYRSSYSDCYYKITTATGKETRIVFMDVHLNYYICGSYDYVKVRDIQPPSLPPGVCSFETGTCGYVEDTADHFNWRRHRGMTTSFNTGPYTDHTTKSITGYYLYTESSTPRRSDEKSRISKMYSGLQVSGSCLSFWYHMHGTQIGRLHVYLKSSSTRALGLPSWSAIGQQGEEWLQAHVNIYKNSTVVVFEGVIGTGFKGDIAIDDILVRSGPCISSATKQLFIIRHHYGGLCVARNPVNDRLILTKSCNEFFTFTDDGSLLHVDTLKCAMPLSTVDNSLIKLQSKCGSWNLMFAQTSASSLKHLQTNKCVHPLNGSYRPAVGTELVIYVGCDELRLRFDLLTAIPSTTSRPVTTRTVTTASTTKEIRTTSVISPGNNSTGNESTTRQMTKMSSTTKTITTKQTTDSTPKKRSSTVSTTSSTSKTSGVPGQSGTIFWSTPQTTAYSKYFDQKDPGASKDKSNDNQNAIIIATSCVVSLMLVLLTICIVFKIKKKHSVEKESVLSTVTLAQDKAKNIYVSSNAGNNTVDGQCSHPVNSRPLPGRPLPMVPSDDQIVRRELRRESLAFAQHSFSEPVLFNAEVRQDLIIENAASNTLASAGRALNGALPGESKLPTNSINDSSRDYIEMKVPSGKLTDQDHDGIYDEIEPSIIEEIIKQSAIPSVLVCNQVGSIRLHGKPRSQTVDESLLSHNSPFVEPKMRQGRKMSENSLPPMIKSFKKPCEQQRRASASMVTAYASPVSLSPFPSPNFSSPGNTCVLEDEDTNYLAPCQLKGPSQTQPMSVNANGTRSLRDHPRKNNWEGNIRESHMCNQISPKYHPKPRSVTLDESLLPSNDPHFGSKMMVRQSRRLSDNSLPPMIKSFRKPDEKQRRCSEPVLSAISGGSPFSSPKFDQCKVMSVLEEEDTNYLAPSELKVASETKPQVAVADQQANKQHVTEQQNNEDINVESNEAYNDGRIDLPMQDPVDRDVDEIFLTTHCNCTGNESDKHTLQEKEEYVEDGNISDNLYVSMIAVDSEMKSDQEVG